MLPDLSSNSMSNKLLAMGGVVLANMLITIVSQSMSNSTIQPQQQQLIPQQLPPPQMPPQQQQMIMAMDVKPAPTFQQPNPVIVQQPKIQLPQDSRRYEIQNQQVENYYYNDQYPYG